MVWEECGGKWLKTILLYYPREAEKEHEKPHAE
jgi:hypothetical protein